MTIATVHPLSTPTSVFRVVKATVPDLVGAWSYIRRGLQEVKGRSKDITWIPEQVRRQIERGFAGENGVELFLCAEEDRIVGFYVMLPQVDPWMNCAVYWLVWIAYAHGGAMVDRGMDSLVAQARERGYAGIDFITSQPWLVERMKVHGFEPMVQMSRKVLEY